jgi:hypothetical protein
MTWTRALPTEPGDYWIAEEHWCNGEPMYLRVFLDLDGVLMCQAVGWLDPCRLDAMPWPSYWKPVELPEPPVFA